MSSFDMDGSPIKSIQQGYTSFILRSNLNLLGTITIPIPVVVAKSFFLCEGRGKDYGSPTLTLPSDRPPSQSSNQSSTIL